jgi:hypothetical protein
MTTRPATPLQTDALGTRREPDWPNYIRDFLYAVYPDFGAAALACFDEKKCLQDATDIINELRAKHSRLVEALRDLIRSHSLGHEAKGRALLRELGESE